MKSKLKKPKLVRAWAFYRELDGDLSDTIYTSRAKANEAFKQTIKNIVKSWPSTPNFGKLMKSFAKKYKVVPIEIKVKQPLLRKRK